MSTKNTAWVSENEKAHGTNWRAWLKHLKDKPASGIEVGTWMGESAEWMLDNVFTHPESTYFCVDTFRGSDEHALAGIDCTNIERDARERLARFGERVRFCVGESHVWLRRLHGLTFDFIYVDAAHDAMNVLRDAVLGFELLAVGGVMIFDDMLWKIMPHAVDCPELAINSFIQCYARRLEVIGMGWQCAVRKIA